MTKFAAESLFDDPVLQNDDPHGGICDIQILRRYYKVPEKIHEPEKQAPLHHFHREE